MSQIDIEIRHAIHPDHAESMGTEELREHFLVTDLFTPGIVKAVYSHFDRMILLGIQPDGAALSLGAELANLVKSDTFLARREIGIFNVGGAGTVIADGKRYPMAKLDALYLPMGTGEVSFESDSKADPALFYANSAPAHVANPVRHIKASEISGDNLGAQENANKRILTKYMHPGAFPTCQLVMGRTELQTGNVWNSMPPHTHDRRMEVYLYHGIGDGQAVFHFMGRPEATRHVVIRNNEAVISPPWSVHCGVGTGSYAFIWSMAGDNQTFTDMDAVPVSTMF
jgi:4-deoxy-L-threo-5-hexosulose-uronate ketol-isomerase